MGWDLRYRQQISESLLLDRGGKRRLSVSKLRADSSLLSKNSTLLHDAIIGAADSLDVSFVEQGNFIVAIVSSSHPPGVLIGVTKRNPTDKENWDRGKRLALDRALQSGKVTWLG